jgi:hypothetical protein
MSITEYELDAIAHRFGMRDENAFDDRNRVAFDAKAPALRARTLTA